MTRKQTRRRVYQICNPISMAIAGAALTDTASLDKLRLRELSALEAFRTGRATEDEWRDLADMLNVSETFCRDGVGPEARETCLQAQDALGAAHRRLREHGRLVFTGEELQILRHAFEYADLQRSSVSRGQFERVVQKTIDRIRSAAPDIKVCI